MGQESVYEQVQALHGIASLRAARAAAGAGGWIKNGVELGIVVDIVTLSALAIAAKKAVELVNNPAYSQHIAAIARGVSHHLVLGRPTVLAALNEVIKLNPAKTECRQPGRRRSGAGNASAGRLRPVTAQILAG